jgi:hypothetical protein
LAKIFFKNGGIQPPCDLHSCAFPVTMTDPGTESLSSIALYAMVISVVFASFCINTILKPGAYQ